jgi:ubiquinone/menaquinone biosynthesis C-methylase UbiE
MEPDLRTVRERFDVIAPAYRDGQAKRLDGARVVALVQPQASDRVLDVATGTGAIGWILAGHVGVVVGTDVSRGMIEAARTAGANGDPTPLFVYAAAEQIPFAAETFTIVTCSRALHHMANPELALAEMYRVARPQATLLIVDSVTYEEPEYDELHNQLERLRDPSHTRALPLSELREHVVSSGFTVDDEQVDTAWRAADTWLEDAGADSQRSIAVHQWLHRARSDHPGFCEQHLARDDGGRVTVRYRIAWLRARRRLD